MDNPVDNTSNKCDNEIPMDGQVSPKRQRLIPSPIPSTTSTLSGLRAASYEDGNCDSLKFTLDSKSSGKEDQDDDTPTALLVPEIFEKVLGYLETGNLLTCRLVNHHWCEFATSINRNNGAIIHFEKPSEMFLSKSSSAATNLTNLETEIAEVQKNSFLDTMRKSQDIPCGKFIINVQKNLNEYQALIDTLGSVITSLEINCAWSVEGIDTFRNWMSTMTKLHTLKMDFCKVFEADILFDQNDQIRLEALKNLEVKSIRGMSEGSLGFFNSLFARAQNLQRLKVDLKDYGLENDTDFEEVDDDEDLAEDEWPDSPDHQAIAEKNAEKIFSSLENYGRLSAMKEMNFTVLTDTFVDRLLQMTKNGLKLKSFQLGTKLDEASFDSDKFCLFLEEQKATLEKMDIYRPSNIVIDFPQNMPALKSLYVRAGDGLQFKTPFDFSKQFPLINELKVHGEWSISAIKDFFEGIDEISPTPCTTLKTLKLPLGSYLDERGLISKISNIFPNVCNLDIRHPRNHSLHEVWTSWPGLTTLKVVGFHSEGEYSAQDEADGDPDRQCLDVGFTGIEQHFCVHNKRTSRNWIRESDRIIEYFKRDPSITDLKDLRKFELKLISVDESCTGSPIGRVVTELLIYLALIKMPHLQHLNIYEWFPAATSTRRVMDCTYDLSLAVVEDLKKILKDTSISVMSMYGRDPKISSNAVDLDYGDLEYLTDIEENVVGTIKACNVLFGGSGRHRGYGSSRSSSPSP